MISYEWIGKVDATEGRTLERKTTRVKVFTV